MRLILALALLAGCQTTTSDTMFKYGDYVCVVEGFYAGNTGTVVGWSSYGFDGVEYYVDLERPGFGVWALETFLDRCTKFPPDPKVMP